MERANLIQDKIKQEGNDYEIKLILDYNIQYKKSEHIIRKHWPILKADTTLGHVLPEKPKFMYKKAQYPNTLI